MVPLEQRAAGGARAALTGAALSHDTQQLLFPHGHPYLTLCSTSCSHHMPQKVADAGAAAAAAPAGMADGAAGCARAGWDLPPWVVDGFEKDEMAHSCEQVQGHPFLLSGRPPAVGQRLYMQVRGWPAASRARSQGGTMGWHGQDIGWRTSAAAHWHDMPGSAHVCWSWPCPILQLASPSLPLPPPAPPLSTAHLPARRQPPAHVPRLGAHGGGGD